MLERALSGYAVATFSMAKNTGLAHTFATAADKQRVQIVLLAVSVCVGAGMALLGGGLLALAALAVLWRYRAVAAKQFGGITGDLAGWFLQRAELVMLAALLISEGWVGVIFITGAAVQAASGRSPGNSAGGRFSTCRISRLRPTIWSGWRTSWRRINDVAAATEIGGGIVRWTRASGARGRRPGGWPACWRRARTR